MAVTLHANNAYGYLAGPVAPGDTTIVLQLGQGALFPTISVGSEQFYVTVENRAVAGAIEIMLVTSKAVDSFTVLRARQGTTAQSFSAGTSVSNRITAAFLNDFDSRIAEAGEIADAAAVAAAAAVVAANAATDGLALKANIASPALTGVPTAPTAAPGTSTTQLATTAFVTAAVAAGGGGGGGGANLDSPAFTGVPTAPTAAPGTNTTQLATTAFVTAAVTQGVTGLAPLASPAFTGVPTGPTAGAGTNTTQLATTAYVTAADALKANITSPTFLGTPLAPTASAGTNTTQLATTAFVTAAVAAGGGGGGGAPDPLVWATLASPAFTGVPTAPTAVPGTSTAQLATTAFVTSAVTTAVTGLAPIASPTFTGVQTGTTASAGTNSTRLATTAFVMTAVAGLATLASPTFTGTPLAPTAAPGTNTTQLATTAFVTGALSGGDPLKAPLASPAFTGVPTAPTAGQGTSSTQIATTAFVTTGLDLKAPLASPALTGVPVAPTAAPGTNTTQLATTAFVTTSVALAGTPTAPTATAGTNTTQLATTAFVQASGAGIINAATAKTLLVDADIMPLTDSAASFAQKKITWANVKASFLAGSTPFSPATLSEWLTGTVPNFHANVDVDRHTSLQQVRAFTSPTFTLNWDGTRVADGSGTTSDSCNVLVSTVNNNVDIRFSGIHAGLKGHPWRIRLVSNSAGTRTVAITTANGITADLNGYTIPNLGATVGDYLELWGTIVSTTNVRLDGMTNGAPVITLPSSVVTLTGSQAITGQKTMTSPILVTPQLGTPASGNLASCTGYPLPAASTTVSGIVELADTTETSAGTDATRSVTPAGLAASNFGVVIVELRLAGDTTSLATGDGKDIWIVPSDMNGWKIESVTGHVITAGTTGASTFMVANTTAGFDVLSSALSVASAGVDATGGTVNTSNNALATNNRIRADVDSVSTTPPKGGRIYLKCRKS